MAAVLINNINNNIKSTASSGLQGFALRFACASRSRLHGSPDAGSVVACAARLAQAPAHCRAYPLAQVPPCRPRLGCAVGGGIRWKNTLIGKY